MREKIKIIYRIFFVIISGICVGIHFNMNDEFFNAHSFSFFTVQSNLLCLIVMCLLLIKYFWNKSLCTRSLVYFKGMALSAIISTFLIYHFGNLAFESNINTAKFYTLPITSILSHYIVPGMFILDWIIFQPKGHFKKWHIVGWLAFPLFYFVCFLSRCYCNTATAFEKVRKFPYFFLDFEKLGITKFIEYIILILFIITAVNIILVIFDQLIAKKGAS